MGLVSPDLLFGSKVEGALRAAGHEVVQGTDGVEAVVVDLTQGEVPAPPEGVPSLGFYSHVEQDVRQAAETAGYDLVVPRSRMNREGAALVERLLGG
ncbi:MAG TPA: hypothetical protein VGW14_06750 [Thermoleophilaceae bacterium]|nr:hypothetical protein [Thermoleophilaceae bacterium]